MIAAPRRTGAWIQPSAHAPAEPRWGHADGLQVGLHPLGGPRGLLRIYAPYLGHPPERLINFIAVEPIPVGSDQRGYSELEPSSLDPERGKRFWSTDRLDDDQPRRDDHPVAGTLEMIDGVERLSVLIIVERFDNGAEVAVKVSFRADRPHEVGLTALRRAGSIPLQSCILSATMGNFARLRRLDLLGRTESSTELWPDFDGTDFTRHATFGLAELCRTETGDAVVSARPDEDDHQAVRYDPSTAAHWKYFGRPAVQTWRAPEPDSDLKVSVNGRFTYWASRSPIPGGVSFENFELIEPFRSGREVFFGIEPIG